MQKIQYLRNYKNKKAGEIDFVSNNVAHGLVEEGVAVLYINRMFISPEDKMMRTETRAERKTRQRAEKQEYKTK